MEIEASAPHARLLVIGNFDGVHLGHQAVLRGAVEEARARGLRASVLTFEPHPAAVLGRQAPPLLTTLTRKRELIEEIAADLQFIAWPFTAQTAALSPRSFAERILTKELRAQVVMVGKNFRFGKHRAGDLETLRQLGDELGFEARAEELRGDDQGSFSSTRVRQSLAAGDVEAARKVLGRPHRVAGRVVPGARRGRILGFPTANLEELDVALPADGVYCGTCLLPGGETRTAVANLGPRPTLSRPHALEVHLLDFAGELYGEHLRLDLLSRVRGVQKFPDVESLRAQIAADVLESRRRLDVLGE